MSSVSTARGRKEGGVGDRQTYVSEKKRKRQTEGEWRGLMVSIYRACRVENKLGQKEKGKRTMEFSKGVISIRPGPGELVRQGRHPLEVQSLPASQATKRC